MFLIGCDPGLTGAIALIGPHGLCSVMDLPIEANTTPGGKVSNRIDVKRLAQLLANWRMQYGLLGDAFACLEQAVPLPGMPSTTTASTFDSYGAIRAVLTLKTERVETVHPQKWKRTYSLASDKDESIRIALNLYPDATPALKRKKDHNRAEAILLAHWLGRKLA